MQSVAPINLTPGVQASTQLDPTVVAVLIANESPYALNVDLVGFTRWIPAWTADKIPIQSMQAVDGNIKFTPTNITSASNAPSSVALITLIQQGDKIDGVYPVALTRQTNIGNGAIPTTATNSLQNDGNTSGTQVIETTPTGQITSAFLLNNDGTMTLRTTDAGVWTTIITVAPGAGGGAATKLFHGTADNVPATGITGAGPIPSAVTQWGSTAGGQQFAIAALNGTGQTGVMDQSNDIAAYSHNNVILGNNNVLSGSNDLFITGNPASQVILGGAALGNNQPIMAYRVNTNTPSAGGTITWSAFRPIPIIQDSGGIGSSGFHIFTGTGAPSGPINGDLWFNS